MMIAAKWHCFCVNVCSHRLNCKCVRDSTQYLLLRVCSYVVRRDSNRYFRFFVSFFVHYVAVGRVAPNWQTDTVSGNSIQGRWDGKTAIIRIRGERWMANKATRLHFSVDQIPSVFIRWVNLQVLVASRSYKFARAHTMAKSLRGVEPTCTFFVCIIIILHFDSRLVFIYVRAHVIPCAHT